MSVFRLFLLSAFLLAGANFAMAQQDAQLDETDVQSSIKGNYLYNFAKYTDWPESRKKGPFIIAIAGNQSLYEEMLNKYATKPIGSQLLEIKLVEAKNQSAGDCHILYIDPSIKSELPRLVKELKSSVSMIVTEGEGALDQGAHINFRKIDNVIRFELNDTRCMKTGIAISYSLKGLATKIQ